MGPYLIENVLEGGFNSYLLERVLSHPPDHTEMAIAPTIFTHTQSPSLEL